MNIGEAAKRAGMSVKTARYYADIGIVTPKQDKFTRYRIYSEEDVGNLQFVGRARRFGFSLKACIELLSLYKNTDRSSKDVKKIAIEKIAEIDKKIDEMKIMRRQLRHLADNCQGDDRPNCPILEAFADGAET